MSKMTIDWRLARDLLEVIGDEIRHHDKQIDVVLRRCYSSHSSHQLDLVYLSREKAGAKILLKGLHEVAAANKPTAGRAGFWAQKVAKTLGISFIERLGMLDPGGPT